MMSSGKIKFLILILLVVVCLSFGAIWVFKLVTEDDPYSKVQEPKRPRAEIEAACRQHVDEARQKASKAITRRAAEFSDFINPRKSGAKPFSKDLVSLYGKWRAVSPYLPFADKEGHEKYVEEEFEQHIFTKQDLAVLFRGVIERIVKDIESIENELAVTLEREIFGQSQSLSLDEVPIAAEAFKKAEERMIVASQWDVGKYSASLVVTEVATIVLVRLGVSAGALTAGAANLWWSFGATLVIGIIVDQIWEWIDNPAGDIEREMITALDKLSQDASTAIEEEMNKKIAQRSELWDKAVAEILS